MQFLLDSRWKELQRQVYCSIFSPCFPAIYPQIDILLQIELKSLAKNKMENMIEAPVMGRPEFC